MSRIIDDFCKRFESEPVKNLSINLKLTGEEYQLLHDFQTFVEGEVREHINSPKAPQISMNDLAHQLIFGSIRSDKKYKAKSKKPKN